MKTAKVPALSRPPRQERSRASLERMLDAAEELLRRRGGGDFTLSEVGRLGRVSIGSIYNRFAGKDDLIRAVQRRLLPELESRQLAAIERACDAGSIPELVEQLVEAMAETLRDYAPIIRPLMQCAVSDPVIAEAGRQIHALLGDRVRAVILRRRGWISHPDPDHAAAALFRIGYAAIARFLGFGSVSARDEGNARFESLKSDLAMMGTAFLMIRPDCARCWTANPGVAVKV